MEPHTLTPSTTAPEAHSTRPTSTPEAPAERLDLSHMEPPKRLAEARLEEVTIDGICGVY